MGLREGGGGVKGGYLGVLAAATASEYRLGGGLT